MPLSKIDSDSLNSPITAVNLAYTGTLTGGTGVVNLGSGQVYKDASGNVGIGTSSPAGRIQVNSAPGTIQIRWSDATNGTANLDTASGLSRIYSNVALAFGTGADAFTERARIDSSGNLLVGTTNSTLYNQGAGVTGLKLSGTNCQMASTGTLFDINNTSGGGINAINWWYRGGNVGNILVNTTSTAYNTTSDYRLKEDIAPMTGALAKVAALKPVTYKWKSTGDASQGFIAHELQAVVPDCVSGAKDAVDADGNPQYQGIDTSFLVATLTAAIQELKAIVDAQGAEIAALKGTP